MGKIWAMEKGKDGIGDFFFFFLMPPHPYSIRPFY